MNRIMIIGDLPNGSQGVRVYKSPEEYLETLISKFGKHRYITHKASRKIANNLTNFYKEINEVIINKEIA